MARTRAKDYDEKRALIREKAVELFAEHGFANTSIAMLAQACGASKAWLYHYYSSKEALLFEIFEQHTQTLLHIFKDVERQQLPPAEALRECLLQLMRVYQQAQATHLVLLYDLNRLPPEEREQIARREREVVDGLAALIDPLASGVWKTHPQWRKPIAMTLMGMINWTFTWLRHDGPVSHEQYAELAGTIFLEGIAALPGGPAPSFLKKGES